MFTIFTQYLTKMLATLLTLWNVMLQQQNHPDDVEDLGRWVSGLFRVVQQPSSDVTTTTSDDDHSKRAATQKQQRQSSSTSLKSSTSSRSTPTTPQTNRKFFSFKDDNDLSSSSSPPDESSTMVIESDVSVRDMRAVFESLKSPIAATTPPPSLVSSSSVSLLSSPPPSSVSSSPAPPSFSAQSSLNDSSALNGRTSSLSDDSLSEYRKVQNSMMKMGDKFADVVCWIGRYIDQENERKVLKGTANPYLAKLRLRHKMELIARLETSADSLEKNIEQMKDRLSAKEASKNKVGEKYSGRLIRNAEDARRSEDEKKRIERECSALRMKIKETERQLSELLDSIDNIQSEVQAAYEQFEWPGTTSVNGHLQDAGDQTDSGCPVNGQNEDGELTDSDDDDDSGSRVTPEWTKKAKEKAKAWKSRAQIVD